MTEDDNDSTRGISYQVDEKNTDNPELPGEPSDEDNQTFKMRTKRRIQHFSDDSGDETLNNHDEAQPSNSSTHSDDNEDNIKNISVKSRIRNMSTSSSDTDSNKVSLQKSEQKIRLTNKTNKMKQKFKGLLKSRIKENSSENKNNIEPENKNSEESNSSENELSSINSIIKIIKGKAAMKSTITLIDPDTSDEEDTQSQQKSHKRKIERKSAKMISPKPARMSAKQAMENMQKIKSESNRMLREKEVSLPYHRPKALSLKDIMSRRKLAVSNDGKALPLKMNNEQLKQYAELLEQRQKEMMELCKSESEDEQADDITSNTDETVDQSQNLITNAPAEELNKNTEIDSPITENSCLDSEKNENCEVNANDDADPESEVSVNLCEPEVNDKLPIANTSSDMKLVYDDSIEETGQDIVMEEIGVTENNFADIVMEDTEVTEKKKNTNLENNEDTKTSSTNTEQFEEIPKNVETEDTQTLINEECLEKNEELKCNGTFSDVEDNDLNMDEIDELIENSAILPENDGITDSPLLIRDAIPLNVKPKLTGAPGMVIDLDGSNALSQRKLTGVELLKERFTYFAKLKTPEEIEREREKRVKPGLQHLKLKQELEDQIAAQRSLEWAKRLEDEKQHQKELKTLRGEDSEADDIDELESKLEESESKAINEDNEVEDGTEEEDEEDDEMLEETEKPRKRNPMVDDEAEESDCDEVDNGEENEANDAEDEGNDDDENNDSSSDSSESEEEEEQSKPRKGRILKAFEDSDEEDVNQQNDLSKLEEKEINSELETKDSLSDKNTLIKDTQDDELQLAQMHKSSEDLFSQESEARSSMSKDNKDEDKEIGTQSFSILDTTNTALDTLSNDNVEIESPTFSILNNEKLNSGSDVLPLSVRDKLSTMCETQPYNEAELTASQILMEPSTQSGFGDDILALCTGKFYDNPFVSQSSETNEKSPKEASVSSDKHCEISPEIKKTDTTAPITNGDDGNLLKSILDELHDPEFDAPKVNKYFFNDSQDKENKQNNLNKQMKKKFVIDSDEDVGDGENDAEPKKKKKLKKKRAEQRALQISDDEEEDYEEDDEYEEDDVSDIENDEERIVEYDSEENEVEVKPREPKKKRKMTEFFEQEAELTSEDEWVGSGDEDERDLDRMEREEGDDDTFHQGKLQRELGQIHMRDVLDQDKREVRLLQELLFEDGDLGEGGRQRKFRWKNADGEDIVGGAVEEFADTQEDEECEELWRKQRHERDVFLREMKMQEEPESPAVNINRTAIIKANLKSKTMSSLLLESTVITEEEGTVLPEKKTTKDIPSPKKPFGVFKQNYHGSILSRGNGAIARLAALATPLAEGDDAPAIGSRASSNNRKFVFAAVADENEPKVTKRKADVPVGTPKLVKKMKTEERQKFPRNSLIDHLNS